jgi:16S rRNA (uracil1498-N3)-methyltransferase
LGEPEPLPASVRSVAQVFVADLGECDPDEPDVHHLSRVLRVRPGETVVASDGAGSWRVCTYTGSDPWLHPEGPVVFTERRRPPVTIGFVPVKGDRPEWVVQKLVEIGVDRLVVLRSERSVVRWEGPRGEAAVERLRKIAAGAACQSRRPWIPEIEGVVALADLCSREPVSLARYGGAAPGVGKVVCVGPEGGFTEEELSLGSANVGLGDTVLRSETAAMVAGVLVCALRDQRMTTSRHS